MSGTPEQFRLAIRAFAEKAGRNAELVTRKIVLDIGASLVELSPVGNPSLWKVSPPKGYVGGRFRANWQYGFNVTPSGTFTAIDPSGDASNARIAGGVGQVSGSGFGVHYLVNNLPYAQALEYGHSSQAPAGMVGITLAKFQAIVNNAAQQVNP